MTAVTYKKSGKTNKLAPKQTSRIKQWPAIGAMSVISTLASVALFSAAPAQAAEKDTGWYAGVNAGSTDTKFSGNGLDDAFSGQGITSSTSANKRDNTYSLNLGYQFNQNFAVEGGYVDLGKYNYNSSISAPATDTASGNYKVDGWTTTAVGIVPLQNGFSAYGKAGVIFSQAKFNTSTTGATAASSTSKSGTNPTYGLGVSYEFSRNLLGKAEWNRYQNVGDSSTGKADIDSYTVGLAYRF